MITFYRCDGTDANFQTLIVALDAELTDRYGAQMDFYGAFNGVAGVYTAVVALDDGKPAGCGCFKQLSDGSVEMKRIFVAQGARKKGIAKGVMARLEEWAAELGYTRAVLETGTSQPEAIGLYESIGYFRIENYPPYVGVHNSVCYEKCLAVE
ncbi:MAG TPA: GNAT family N-acetyltransferase [Feifaniaceae bacterium]|nr:GNAT family N-acetyltransferase [Feifaniaceae bacterium]